MIQKMILFNPRSFENGLIDLKFLDSYSSRCKTKSYRISLKSRVRIWFMSFRKHSIAQYLTPQATDWPRISISFIVPDSQPQPKISSKSKEIASCSVTQTYIRTSLYTFIFVTRWFSLQDYERWRKNFLLLPKVSFWKPELRIYAISPRKQLKSSKNPKFWVFCNGWWKTRTFSASMRGNERTRQNFTDWHRFPHILSEDPYRAMQKILNTILSWTFDRLQFTYLQTKHKLFVQVFTNNFGYNLCFQSLIELFVQRKRIIVGILNDEFNVVLTFFVARQVSELLTFRNHVLFTWRLFSSNIQLEISSRLEQISLLIRVCSSYLCNQFSKWWTNERKWEKSNENFISITR